MTCIIRKIVDGHFQNYADVAADEWRLREQVEALEVWLQEHVGELDPQHEWVADIGFCMRGDALGGGPPITRALMKLCLEANLEIYLSEYPGMAQPPDAPDA